jgi:L-fuconolactonase
MAAADRTARSSIVDSHQHVWDPAAHAQPWLDSDEALAPLRRVFSIEELAPQAEAAGVIATVVVQTITEPAETPELLLLASTHPLVGAVVGWTDLTSPAVGGALEQLRSLPGGDNLAGVRHPLLTEPDAEWLSRSDVRRGLAVLAAAGLSFDLVLHPAQLPSATAAAETLPELTFVLDHLGNVDVEAGTEPDALWAEPFREFAALPNTVCKLSGILSMPGTERVLRSGSDGGREETPPVGHLRPYFELALECFGPTRLMFGSDWPVCTLTTSYADVISRATALTGELSTAEQDAIWSSTARRVYHVGGR